MGTIAGLGGGATGVGGQSGGAGGQSSGAGGTSTGQSCKGFDVLGLKNSPGGSTLPNTCKPFDGTLNNPYAIRCIDADPTYSIGYPGNEYCILPPPEGLGTQVHIGPSDYAAPGQFALAPGAEVSDFYSINAPNPEAHHYYRSNWRMRPGGHHMLIAMMASDQADGWARSGDMGTEFGGRGKSFGGAQRPSVDRPQGTLEIPPENAGLGEQIAARQQFTFNLHHINTGTTTLLREVWVNVWYVKEENLKAPIVTFAGTGNPADMSIAPGQHVQRSYACTSAGATRIISLYGHYHAHDVHFGVSVVRASGTISPVYDSFDWEDIPVYQYDSISTNPVARVAERVDGAASGLLELTAGDQLQFDCDINNDSSKTLRFADEAITGEMCILFGSYTGANPCPAAQRVK